MRSGLLSAPVGPLEVPGGPSADDKEVQRAVQRDSRPCADVFCLLLFAVLSAATVALGAQSASMDFSATTDLSCFAESSLNITHAQAQQAASIAAAGATAQQAKLRASAQHISEELRTHQHDIVFAVLVSFFAAVLYVQMLQRFAVCVTYVSVFFAPLTGVVLGALIMGDVIPTEPEEQKQMAGASFGFAALCVIMIACKWKTIKQTSKLIHEAAVCLQHNTGLVLTTVLVVLLTAVVGALYAMCVIYAYFDQECHPVHGPVMTSFGKAKLVLSVVMFLWTTKTCVEIRVGHVAGAVGLWYFHSHDKSYDYPKSPALTSLKWCLTSSAGSMATGGLVLAITSLIRAAVEKAREQSQRAKNPAARAVMCCVYCCTNCVVSCIQTVTKFSTITSVITGKGFWGATKLTMKVFRKNGWSKGLSAWAVDSFAHWIIFLTSMATGLVISAATYAIILGTHKDDPNKQTVAKLYTLIAGVISWLVFHLVSGIILSIVDSLWMCYALDVHEGSLPAPHVENIYELYEMKAQAVSSRHVEVEAAEQANGNGDASYTGVANA